MEEMVALQTSINTISKDMTATEGGEVLALFMKDQLEKVEATKELVDRVNEFRDTIGAADGLEGVQEQGRRVIDEKVKIFQVGCHIWLFVLQIFVFCGVVSSVRQ